MQFFKYLFQLILALLAIGFLLVVWPGVKKEEFEEFKNSLAEGKGFFEGIGEMFKRDIPSDEEILATEAEQATAQAPGVVSSEEPAEPSVYPMEMSVRNLAGNQIEVTIMGRSTKAISMIRKSDGQAFAYPIASLSAVDNTALSALPITLREDQLPKEATVAPPSADTTSVPSAAAPSAGYPLDLKIQSLSGEKVEITVMGRSEEIVSFIRKSDREAFASPLASLSEAERAIILTLPVNLRADQLPRPKAAAEAANPRIAKLEHEIADLKERKSVESAKMATGLTTAQKQILRRKLDDYQARIHQLELDLKAIQ